MKPPAIVVPAQAGTHNPKSWLLRRVKKGDEHHLAHDRRGVWIPAFAGMTN
jgi:hypothetical protein